MPHRDNIGVVFLGPTFANSEAGLRQTLSATLQTFTRYTLTVAVGNMANSAEPNNDYSFTGFPGYRVDLLAGQQLGIRLVNLDSAAGIEVNFDNVHLDATAIPEPSTAAFLAGAAALFALARRHRRKQSA